MKGCTHWGRHMLAVLLAGAMLVSELPAAVAADMPTTRLHLTPPESGQVQTTTFIQDQFNLSVIGYGAAGNTGSNVEGPNKVWNGPEVSGTTDYVENGNLTIIPTEEAGGTGLVEDDGVFQFYLHDREDYDSTGVRYDRQRIEIKSHDRSDAKAENAPALAMEDDIYTYRWKFKLPENCYTPLSENQDEKLANFFHIFQLKAIRGGENAMPVATFTIEDDYLMFQQIPISGRGMGYNNIIGDKIPLKDIEGKWLSAAVTVLYRDEGYIHVKLDDMETDTELINTGAELDTWRRPELGEGATTYESDFPAVVGQGIRCKWGLYRKYIPDAYRLNPEEGGNSAINEAALPSWWTDAAMWVGDIEVKREDRSSYRFPAGFDVGDYTLPAEGEGLEEHSAPLDGGINYAKDASIKICGKEGNSHDGDKLLDGDETTSWDTPKAMLNTDSANANKVYWAALDLGAVHDINKFIIQFNTTSNKLCGYQIYSAGADGKAAYDEIQDGQTDDPRKLTHWDAWDEVEGVGYHPGVNKYVKAYQMNIFDAANGSFDALEDVQYLLILGDVVHDNSEKSIKTTMFKAINTDEQPEIPSAGYDLGENLAAGDQVRVKVSTASEHKPDGMSLNPKEYTSQFLIDNDDTTVWSTNSSQVNENVASAGYKYWAAVDLGEEKEINQFRIKWGTVSDRLSSYQVFFSSEDDDFNSLIERMGTITPDESGKAPTKNPIAEQGNQWKPATNKVTRGVANNEEVILSVENDATAEDISTIEQTEQESELNASEQSDEENEETKDETDDSESTDIPKETADSEQPEEKVQDEDAVAENLMFLPNENDVYAALPSMFGTLARAKAVSEQETEAPSITARYLLLLCDVNVTEKAGAINTASFEAFHAVPTTVAVECHAERLGTIKMLPGLIKDEITAALLPQRFSVKLTGGINYALMVDWNQEDIDKLNPDEPGTYEIRGTLLVPEDVTLDFETNDVSKEIVRVIVIEEPKQEESQPPVDPDDPDQPPVDPDDPNQPPVDPDDPNQPPVDPDDPNQPPVDPDDPNQPPVDPDDPDQPPVDPDDPNQP
ncbi:MAG: discoidin domain-containing protein, partial [Clostridiaceae bacterium]|nr:discoidin domain-containing protein [Clostridiaceae bacterium]